jgi:hypothetical protein
MIRRASPPAEVMLVYRKVGQSHVFTAIDFPGFYIGSSSLEHAFEQAARGLSQHVSKLYGSSVDYIFNPNFLEFKKRLKGGDLVNNFVLAKISKLL